MVVPSPESVSCGNGSSSCASGGADGGCGRLELETFASSAFVASIWSRPAGGRVGTAGRPVWSYRALAVGGERVTAPQGATWAGRAAQELDQHP